MPKAGLPPHKTTDTMSFADATHFHPDPPLAQDSHERFTAMAKTGARKNLPKEYAAAPVDFAAKAGKVHSKGKGKGKSKSKGKAKSSRCQKQHTVRKRMVQRRKVVRKRKRFWKTVACQRQRQRKSRQIRADVLRMR